MSVEGPAVIPGIAPLDSVFFLVRIAILLLASLYFIFSLIVVRQVHLMTETVITEGGPILRALSILHAGLALAIIILFIGFLFG